MHLADPGAGYPLEGPVHSLPCGAVKRRRASLVDSVPEAPVALAELGDLAAARKLADEPQ